MSFGYVHVDKHGISNFSTYISVDIAHHEIFRAKVGKSGINVFIHHILSVKDICTKLAWSSTNAITCLRICLLSKQNLFAYITSTVLFSNLKSRTAHLGTNCNYIEGAGMGHLFQFSTIHVLPIKIRHTLTPSSYQK